MAPVLHHRASALRSPRKTVTSVTKRRSIGVSPPLLPYPDGMRGQRTAAVGSVFLLAAVGIGYAWPAERPVAAILGTSGLVLVIWGLIVRHRLASIEAVGDVDLLWAIYYVTFGKWHGRANLISEPALIPFISRAKKQIIQRALHGDLPVWGEDSSNNMARIPKRAWRNLDLDLMRVIHADCENLAARPRDIRSAGIEHYTRLKTSKAIVERLWRKAIIRRNFEFGRDHPTAASALDTAPIELPRGRRTISS